MLARPNLSKLPILSQMASVLRIRIRIRIHRIHMFLGLQDPDPDTLVRSMDPDPSIIMQK
jgi:hypothetical protein